MNDVLLTNTEEGNIEIPYGLTEYQQNRERYKAQCLKLLDVLKEPCKEHSVVIGEHYFHRWECDWCMSEIEKLLKEQTK